MGAFDIDIDDRSLWVTATPVDKNVTMPFYITEVGHFFARRDYVTERTGHDSYMLIFTLGGRGCLRTGGFRGALSEGEAVIFDCREPHYYRSETDEWDFFWMHLRGSGAAGMISAINYDGIRAVKIDDIDGFAARMNGVASLADKNDIKTVSAISADVHMILNMMIEGSLGGTDSGGVHAREIKEAVRFIEGNYMNQISVEDITKRIHVSKYYFIRLFRQSMGMSPYSYLINYRINRSKILLRTESVGIGEIAGRVGFADVSNFITQFKKQTGQKPMDYRRRFLRPQTGV